MSAFPPGVEAVPISVLLANPRGVAFAAKGSVNQIAQLLGVDIQEAARFQAIAKQHFDGMMAHVRQGTRG